MRAPSVETLKKNFRLSSAEARKIRAFAKAVDDEDELRKLVETLPETSNYVRRLYSSPYNSHMWRVTVVMHALSEILGGYGVEALGPDPHGPYPPPYEYVNMGDTYAATLIYSRNKENLFVGSWGDIAERHPNWN